MTEQTETRTRAPRSPNITGARELRLIEELAVGDRSYAELAEAYELSNTSTIANFANRNRQRIAEAARGQADHLRHLWVTRKEMRIVTYQAEIERNIRLIEGIEEAVADISNSVGLPISPDTDKIARLQANMFRAQQAVAEETGEAHPTQSYRYTLEGEDVEGWPEP